MYKKLARDIAVVFFAYFWALALVNRLIGVVIYAIFPQNIFTLTFVLGTAFALSYLSSWFLFNQWKAKFWIQTLVAVGIFLVAYVLGYLIDAATVINMTHLRTRQP